MAVVPEIIIDQAQLDRVQANLAGIKNGARKAVAGAINDVLLTSRTNLARGVRDKVVVKYGRVLRQIKLNRATPENIAASIRIDDKDRPGLKSFGARQTRSGVTYRISKTGGRKKIASAFEARGRPPRGSVGISAAGIDDSSRAIRIFRRAGKKRLPLLDLKGPSVNRVIKKNDIDADVANQMRTKLPGRIDARMSVMIERGR